MNSPRFFSLIHMSIIPAFEPFLSLGDGRGSLVPLSTIAWCVVALFHHEISSHPSTYWPHCNLLASLLPRLSATCRTLSCGQAWPGIRLHIPGHGVWLLEQLHKGANDTTWKCRAINSHWGQTMANGIWERGEIQADCFISSPFQDMNSPYHLTREVCLAEWVHW